MSFLQVEGLSSSPSYLGLHGNRAGLGYQKLFPSGLIPHHDSALWAPGTPWPLQKSPGLHTGPSQAAPCPADPKDTVCLERFHHFLKGPDKPRLLAHRPRGSPCMGSSVGKLSTGRIFISASLGHSCKHSALMEMRQSESLGFTSEDQVFFPKHYVETKMTPFKKIERVTWGLDDTLV